MNHKLLIRFSQTVIAAFALIILSTGCQTSPESAATSSANQIFDEHTSGKTLVSAALDEAKAENKKVILLFGANWCPYCRKLHALFENDPEVHALVDKEFVVVPIDVGTSTHNRNLNLIDKYHSNVFTDGTPSVVIVDANGKRLAPTDSNPWSAKNPIEAGRVLTFLKQAGGG